MLIDLHTHTSRYSGCSILAPEELCRLALERGLDAIVVTEHYVLWSPKERDELQAQFPELRIYRGVEVSVREGYDVICITAEPYLPVESMPSMAEVLEMLDSIREEVFLFVAHPFRFDSALTPGLREVMESVDGIEMNSINIFKKNPVKTEAGYAPVNAHCYQAARERFGLRPFYNTDCHHPYAVGGIANILDTDTLPEDEIALATLLRRALVSEYQNPSVIERFLQACT